MTNDISFLYINSLTGMKEIRQIILNDLYSGFWASRCIYHHTYYNKSIYQL